MSAATKLHSLIAQEITTVSPLQVRQNTALPYATYQRVSRVNLSENSTYRRARYQISVYASTYAEIENKCDTLITILDNYKDDEIAQISIENEIDSYEDDIDIYSRLIDIFIHTK